MEKCDKCGEFIEFARLCPLCAHYEKERLKRSAKKCEERARKAEALVRELVEVLEGVQRLKPLIAYPDDVLPEFEEEAMAIANMLNVVDSIVAKAKEVLGDDKVHAGRQSMGAKDY